MEFIILALAWIVPAILLIIFINKKTFLDAQVSFLFMQVPSWLLGALVVENRLIEYPEGFLESTYRASFTFEFFVFPAVSALFNTHFPRERSMFIKIIYTISLPAVITVLEVLLEKYTNLIEYINWTWYWSFISMTIVLLISYWYYRWFINKIKQYYKNN
jgi:hypothetical protein